jgi:phosphate transport system protein
MAEHLQRELKKIKGMILSLGAAVETRVRDTIGVIETFDAGLADKIIKSDHEIDEMEVEVEEECLKIMALHQPVAVDLRFLVAVIKINNDLERIADQAVNVAQRVKTITKEEKIDLVFDYSVMAEKAETMLKMSLDALVNFDLDAALKVLTLDDEVDEIKNEAYRLIKRVLQENPDHVGYLINLLLISRHLERMADHATNIAEEVVYMIEGEIVRHSNLQSFSHHPFGK